MHRSFSTPCFDGAHNMIMGGSWASTGDEASAYSRFHFRPHFFQHAGLRLVCEDADATARGASPVVRLSKRGLADDVSGAPPSATTGGALNAGEGKSTDSSGLSYESSKLLDEYMMLHFGAPEDVLPFDALPKGWLNFPQRCAQLVDAWATKLDLPKGRALDIGCAVGGSTFELARTYDDVVGVDLSASFIAAAQRMHAEREVQYLRRDEGELGETAVARLDGLDAAGDIQFERADACALPHELGGFDACLLGNLLCRLPSPKACLSRLGGPDGLVRPGGLAVVVSPYTWMEEHMPKETVRACRQTACLASHNLSLPLAASPCLSPSPSHFLSQHLGSRLANAVSFLTSPLPSSPPCAQWLGGFTTADGERILSDATLRTLFAEIGFDELHQEDMPLLIREHKRKYQLVVSHAMVFRRRVDS